MSPQSLEQNYQFVKASWRIIELKLFYYHPEKVHPSWHERCTVGDDEYDALEQRYLTMCREMKRPNTLVHKGYPGFEDVGCEHAMGEVDFGRPSVQLVLAKLSQPRKIYRRQV